MVAKLVVAVVICLSIITQSSPAYGFCSSDFADDPEYPYKYFQTKTRYDTVRGELTTSIRPPECTPQSIVLLLRHGARHSGNDEIDKFELLQELITKINSTGNAELCRKDLQKIMNWKNWHQPNKDKDLAPTGKAEMKGLADRFSKVFPELFSKSNNKLRFIAAEKRRAAQSAKAFAGELFPATEYEIESDNGLLRFYEECRRYILEVDENDALLEDVDNFSEGPVIEEMAKQVAKRLGVPEEEVGTEETKIMQKEGCAEQEWVTGKDSPWCAAFTKEDMQVFEYEEDMDDYITKSFGQEISYRQSCKLKHFILSALEDASMNEDQRVTNHFLFGHSKTMLTLLTEMNLIEDDGPFTSEDYPEKVEREFRSSINTPASGNLAFVTYKCGATDDIKLQILQNEKIMTGHLVEPGDYGLENLEDALLYFGYYDEEDCPWDEMCHVEEDEERKKGDDETKEGAIEAVALLGVLAFVLLFAYKTY